MGDHLELFGHGHVNATVVPNDVNGSDAISFVQMLGDGHSHTVVMMGRYDNHSLPYMYYHQGERKHLDFNWLLVSSVAPKSDQFQYGSFDMEFHSAEKCHKVTFDQVLCFFLFHVLAMLSFRSIFTQHCCDNIE